MITLCGSEMGKERELGLELCLKSEEEVERRVSEGVTGVAIA